MKIAWKDVEAHRSAVTELQWRRMQAYFRDGKSFMEIAADEGATEAKSSLVLGLGRGCIAVLNSMLGLPARVPTESKALVCELQQLFRRVDGVETTSSKHVDEGTADVVCEVEDGFAVDQGELEAHRSPSVSMSSPERVAIRFGMRVQGSSENQILSTAAGDVDHPPETPQLKCTIAPRMRVEGDNGASRASGSVESILGDMAVVVWDSGFKKLVPIVKLTPLSASEGSTGS